MILCLKLVTVFEDFRPDCRFQILGPMYERPFCRPGLKRGRCGQRGHTDQWRTIVCGFLVRVLDFHIGQNLKHAQLFRGRFEHKKFERSLPDFLCFSCFSKVNICLFTPFYFFRVVLPESLSLFVDTACTWWWPLLEQPGRIEKCTSVLSHFPLSIFYLLHDNQSGFLDKSRTCPQFSSPRFRFSHWAKSKTRTTMSLTMYLLCCFALAFLRSLRFA